MSQQPAEKVINGHQQVGKRPSSDAVNIRSMFHGHAHEVVQNFILSDIRNATMSRKFRAYYRVRPFLPLAIRQRLQRSRGGRLLADDQWFIHTQFLKKLAEGIRRDILNGNDQIVAPWPIGQKIAIVLTHDVETEIGCKRVDQIARMEESLGLRSCWNFVPHLYPIDLGLLEDLRSRGHEIGVHGYNHDGRLFSSRRIFTKRLPAINDAVSRFDATGFRAPMVHRRLEWIEKLSVEYDASCFDVDPFQAMPGGVGSLWPFCFNELIELPYTVPQDHTLMISLNEDAGAVWRKKVDVIEKWRGMVLPITHPDYLDSWDRLDSYRRLLEYLCSIEGGWRTLPRDVASWWKTRERFIQEIALGSSPLEQDQPSPALKTTLNNLFGNVLEYW